MLLCKVVLLIHVTPEGCEYCPFTPGGGFIRLGWYREILQLFVQYNDRLLGQEGVLGRSGVEVRGRGSTVNQELLGSVESRGVGRAIKDVSGLFEEREDGRETVRVR